MGDTREDWAKIEYDFIVSDEAFNDMPHDLQLAYLRWWVTAVTLRRQVFAPRGVKSGALGYRARVSPDLMCRVIDACCANGLAVRGNSGNVKLRGLLRLHGKLSGWSSAPWPGKSEGVSTGRFTADSVSDERRGEESERRTPLTPLGGAVASLPEPSRRQAFETLRASIGKTVRYAVKNGISYQASVSPTSHKLVLVAIGYPNAEPVALGRGDAWDTYEWKEKQP